MAPPAPSLDAIRDTITAVDQELVRLVAERVRLARAAGEAKRALGHPVLDPAREQAVLDRAAQLAREEGVDEDATRRIFEEIMRIARAAQDRDAR